MTPQKIVLWRSAQTDYEEGYSMEIWREDGRYYMRLQGENVMDGEYDETTEVTEEEALEAMMEDAEHECEE